MTRLFRSCAACIVAVLSASAPPILAGSALDGLTPARAFREFNKKNSPELPESIVTDLLQDEDGLLWIATLGGLATYDGSALVAVHDPQAPAGGGTLFARRRGGGLYASSRRGVHVYDGRGWRLLATPQPVEAMAEQDGRWVWAMFGSRVFRAPAAAAAAAWEPVALAIDVGPVPLVVSDRACGVFVLGRRGYLNCREAECRPFAPVAQTPERITALLVTRVGALWLATWDGRLQVWEPGASDWKSLDLGRWPSGGIRSLAEDRAGTVWAGGMARLCHGGAREPWTCWGSEAGLPDSAALALLADREGTLWIGLNGMGLLQWVGEAWSHLVNWPGAPAGGLDATGVAATSDGGALVSAFGKGVLRWDGRRATTWGRRDGLDEDVRAVIEPSPGMVWAASRHGIYEGSRRGGFRKTLSLGTGFVNGFTRDPAGQWYAWTEAYGIFRRTGERWMPAEDLDALVPERSVSTMAWIGDQLWIGSPTRLLVRSSDGSLARFAIGREHELPESVRAILKVGPGEVWVGGIGGIAAFHGGRPRLLEDGVPGNVYFLRRSPDGAIWAGGSKGIVRHRNGRFVSYDATSGLIAEECNQGAAVFPDGSLLAATSGSLARFDASVAEAPVAPLRIRWRGPATTSAEGIVRLAAHQRRLELAWSAPWLAPQPVEYRTRVGSGAAWSPPARGAQMTVENLTPGVWEIAVAARLAGSGDGAWSVPATLRVELSPRLWETAGARAAGLALLAGVALLLARLYVNRLHERRERALARLRSDFMASASHELRTPIAQIRLFADTLRLNRVRDERERVEALDTIHRATQRLETLAGNLLQIARGEAGPPALVAQETDVGELLRTVAREMGALAGFRSMTFSVEAAPGIGAHVDPGALRQAVTNLVDNAIKYGPAGQRVRLGAERTEDGLRLVVEDQGPGIPRPERERVWRRFERLERDRHSSVAGTGIGLAVVRETVERCGGRAWIEDVAPTGTRVVVLLPQAAPDPAPRAAALPEASR